VQDDTGHSESGATNTYTSRDLLISGGTTQPVRIQMDECGEHMVGRSYNTTAQFTAHLQDERDSLMYRTSQQNQMHAAQGGLSSRSKLSSEPTSRSAVSKRNFQQSLNMQHQLLNETKCMQGMVHAMHQQLRGPASKQPANTTAEVRSRDRDTTSVSKSSSRLPSGRQPQKLRLELLSDRSMSPRTYLNQGNTIN
jgi:hypothetical protein